MGTTLVVDDDPECLRLYQRFFSLLDQPVRCAKNGAEALDLFLRHRQEISVIITDWNMPVMDGLALAAAIREIDQNLKIFLLSGCPKDSLPPEATKIITDFWPKPFSLSRLTSCIV